MVDDDEATSVLQAGVVLAATLAAPSGATFSFAPAAAATPDAPAFPAVPSSRAFSGVPRLAASAVPAFTPAGRMTLLADALAVENNARVEAIRREVEVTLQHMRERHEWQKKKDDEDHAQRMQFREEKHRLKMELLRMEIVKRKGGDIPSNPQD